MTTEAQPLRVSRDAVAILLVAFGYPKITSDEPKTTLAHKLQEEELEEHDDEQS